MFTTIGVILPSRGLIFAEVLKAIEDQRTLSTPFFYHICYDKVIPDSLNYLLDEALTKSYDYLLFVEEDTVPPQGCIAEMIDVARSKEKPCVVAVDYPLYNGASSIWRSKKTGEVSFCGFGCTLIDPAVFRWLQEPYFRSDMEAMIGEEGKEIRWQKTDRAGYGRHDIYFFNKVREAGFPIYQLEGYEAKHLKVIDYGKELTNKGLHNIGLKADKITQRYTL